MSDPGRPAARREPEAESAADPGRPAARREPAAPPRVRDVADLPTRTEPPAITTEYAWASPAEPPPHPLAGTALWLAISGLGVSLVVGWGFPLAIGGIVVGALALRRPGDRRGVAAWAIGLAALSLVYSVGWLIWAFGRL